MKNSVAKLMKFGKAALERSRFQLSTKHRPPRPSLECSDIVKGKFLQIFESSPEAEVIRCETDAFCAWLTVLLEREGTKSEDITQDSSEGFSVTALELDASHLSSLDCERIFWLDMHTASIYLHAVYEARQWEGGEKLCRFMLHSLSLRRKGPRD